MEKPRHQSDPGNGALGIRNGVWLAVFGLVLLCLFIGTAFPPRRDQIKSESAPEAEVEFRSGSLTRSKVGISEGIQAANSEFGAGGGWWFHAPRTAEEAARFASDAANHRARELYGCEPFGYERIAQVIDGRWVWSQSRGQGRADIEATVEFALDGSMQSVNVLWLESSPERF